MIDWISATIPCMHNSDVLTSGYVVSLDANNDVQWTVTKKLSVEGSYSSKIQIASNGSDIYITGNPVKFLQGHNLFGTNDLNDLMNKFFDKLLTLDLGLHPTTEQRENIRKGFYNLSRVDVNETWHLNNKNDVMAWIRAVGNTGYMKHRGVGQFSHDTVYFGQKSRRWSLKCYSKGHEIKAKGHHLPKDLQFPEMLEYADKSLRIEGCIRSLELKRLGLHFAHHWTVDTAKVLLLNLLSNLQLSDTYMLKDDVLDTLPTRLRLVYQTWLNGDDLKHIYKKSQYYAIRKQMLAYGVDIASPSPQEKTNVIPLVRVLEAQPVGIPDWAYEKGLVA